MIFLCLIIPVDTFIDAHSFLHFKSNVDWCYHDNVILYYTQTNSIINHVIIMDLLLTNLSEKAE